MHEIDIWSIPWGHQDDDGKKKKEKWNKFVQTDTKQIDHQPRETMTAAEEMIERWYNFFFFL